MAETANVYLRLPNRAENVQVVRQALTGLAELLALDAIELNDLNTAVSEACNNVVMHAYGDGEGPLTVYVYALAGAITVVVRDHGSGMHPCEEEEEEEEGHAGLGIPVIEALSREAQFIDLADGGTEVHMEFPAPNAGAITPLLSEVQDSGAVEHYERTGTIELRLAPTAVARAVLPRVLCTLAARAYFSTDRISDVQLVADVLAANASESISGSHLDVGITVASRNLDLRIGPLRAGRGESLVSAAADGMAPVIERLTDTRRVARADSAETLELRLIDRR